MKITNKKLRHTTFKILDELFLDSDERSLYDLFPGPQDFKVFMDMFIRLTEITTSLLSINNLPCEAKDVLSLWKKEQKYDNPDLSYVQDMVSEVLDFPKGDVLDWCGLYMFFLNVYPVILRYSKHMIGFDSSELIREYAHARAKRSVDEKNKDFLELRKWVYDDFEKVMQKRKKITPYYYAKNHWLDVQEYANNHNLKWMQDNGDHDYQRSVLNMFYNNKDWMKQYENKKITLSRKGNT